MPTVTTSGSGEPHAADAPPDRIRTAPRNQPGTAGPVHVALRTFDAKEPEQRAEVEHLLKALVERVEADRTRLLEECDRLRNELQEAQAEADHAKSDQICMAQDVAGMFDELRAVVERHADHADDLEQVRDELDRARQDVDLRREEADRERTRIANMQAADAEHTEREMARLQAEPTR